MFPLTIMCELTKHVRKMNNGLCHYTYKDTYCTALNWIVFYYTIFFHNIVFEYPYPYE